MRTILILLLTFGLQSFLLTGPARAAKTLEVYVIDVEGGEATLFVSPSGESMLVDTGWPGFEGRDPDRIAAAAKQAGVKQIDYLVISHFHGDHMGGVAQLAARLPIKHFIDHGSVAQGERPDPSFTSYAEIRSKGSYVEAKPGDKIPIAGLNVQVIASNGAVLHSPLAGAGKPNPNCDGFKLRDAVNTEDPRSVSTFITYGKFHTVIMGDLTWNKEHDLMCPNNQIGTVDVYLVSHHGSDTSGSEALVYALHPRVAIMNNGPSKGGAVQTFQILRGSPGLEDFWQNHYSIPGGKEYNMPDQFIANLQEPGTADTKAKQSAGGTHLEAAYWIKLSAQNDGGFTVTNSRNGFTKTYKPKK
jgi:competence protein ComEC